MNKLAIFSAALLLATIPNLRAATTVMAAGSPAHLRLNRWQPGRGLFQLPLWPKERRIDAPELTGAETVESSSGKVAGKRWIAVGNVARPTMTIYPAEGHKTGAAIVVFPGGGYKELAIDLEGSEICRWAYAHGNICAVLKYRVYGRRTRSSADATALCTLRNGALSIDRSGGPSEVGGAALNAFEARPRTIAACTTIAGSSL